MDNSGKIYSLLDQASFNQWLTEFFNKKSNELAYSRQNQPKRMEKLVLDLSTANTAGYKVPVPFKSCVISQVYSTSTGTAKYGSIQILFDQPNIGNLKNAVNLFVNDTLKSDTLFTESYLLWSAQADTTIELYFFPDLEVSTGTTKTQIVGTVTTSNGIASPTATQQFYYSNATGSNFYTVPAGKYAVIRVSIASVQAVYGQLKINGNIAMEIGANVGYALCSSQTFVIKAGDILSAFSSGVANVVSGSIEEYTVI